MGVLAVMRSYGMLASFRIPPDEFGLEIDRKPDLTPEQRARQKEAIVAYTAALEVARNRVVPLAVAELLLGAAMIVFAQRATVGRAWARLALVQLTVAHVALSGVEWVLTPDLRVPEDNLLLAYGNVDSQPVMTGGTSKLLGIAFGVGFSAVIILGLTLPGSRAFYAEVERLREA
jgi:predicted lysophospholipase L1 biosynthesis ABC-type transport system permease subunit